MIDVKVLMKSLTQEELLEAAERIADAIEGWGAA